MGSIWLLVLVIVLNNGEVQTSVRFSTVPEYNNEQSCNEAGQAMADKEQSIIGIEKGKVYWQCNNASLDEMLRASRPKTNEQSL